MDRLRAYLHKLPKQQRIIYAARAGTTVGYLTKIMYDKRAPRMDGALCRRLDEESGGEVPRASLRPDIWPKYDTKSGSCCLYYATGCPRNPLTGEPDNGS